MKAHPVDAPVALILTSAVLMGGEIVPSGTPVELTNSEARNLMGRDRARLPTPEEIALHWPELVEQEPEDPPEDPPPPAGDEPPPPPANPEPAAKPPIKAKR